MTTTAKKEVSKTVQYIQNQWDIQSNALGASHYRITLRSRKEGSNAAWNLGKGKGKNEEERFWTAEEVRGMIAKLASYNARKNEIYITPIDNRYHFLLVDDVKPEDVQEIQKEYTVCECHSSSENNVQVIIKIDRDQARPHAQEQSIANEVLRELNCRWGDPGLTGVRRPFRMVGFRNKKIGRNDYQAKIISAKGEKCPAARDDYFLIAEKRGSAIAQDIIEQTALAIDFKELAKTNRATTATGLEFCREWKKNAGLAKSKGWELDESVVDFRAALALLRRGYRKEEIGAAILQFSPALCARHKNAEQYVAITLQNAEKKLERGSRDMERGMGRGL